MSTCRKIVRSCPVFIEKSDSFFSNQKPRLQNVEWKIFTFVVLTVTRKLPRCSQGVARMKQTKTPMRNNYFHRTIQNKRFAFKECVVHMLTWGPRSSPSDLRPPLGIPGFFAAVPVRLLPRRARSSSPADSRGSCATATASRLCSDTWKDVPTSVFKLRIPKRATPFPTSKPREFSLYR